MQSTGRSSHSPRLRRGARRVDERERRVAVAAFSTLLPFGLLGALPPSDAWWTVPLTVVIAGVFIILERVGAILDAPFANTVNDVPITAICRDIERDLLEQLGEHILPDPVPVVAGYLW
jgi:ion channel-forming bestrophin family protein